VIASLAPWEIGTNPSMRGGRHSPTTTCRPPPSFPDTNNASGPVGWTIPPACGTDPGIGSRVRDQARIPPAHLAILGFRASHRIILGQARECETEPGIPHVVRFHLGVGYPQVFVSWGSVSTG
jgi:hypothetical protein